MNPANWLLYSLLVGGLTTLSAWQASRSARLMSKAGRWSWLVAGVLTVTLPLFASFRPPIDTDRILPVGPSWNWPEPIPTETETLGDAAGSAVSPPARPSDLAIVWLLLSSATALWVVVSQRRLGRVSRRWKRDSANGTEFVVSEDFGPAVVGILRPQIVLPVWALSLPEDALALVLQHEREHLRQHDTRLLGLMALLLVVMPWQPFLWLQLAGLRLAIELDCDRRVLARMPDVARYGDALLELAGRIVRGGTPQHWGLQFATLWVLPSQLEIRLRAMASQRAGSRPLIAAGVSLAVAALVLACTAEPPSAATPPSPRQSTLEKATSLDDRAREQAEIEQRLVQNFSLPTSKHVRDEIPIYWLVTEKDGSVVRKGQGAREIIYLSEAEYGTRFKEMSEVMERRSGKKNSHEGGVYSLSDAEVYRRFPDLNRRLATYGMSFAVFGPDSVLVVYATLQPVINESQ